MNGSGSVIGGVLTTHPLTRYLCEPRVVAEEDRMVARPRDHVVLDVDMNACIHCGICAATCATACRDSCAFSRSRDRAHRMDVQTVRLRIP